MGLLIAGYDLGAILLCFVAIALLLIAKNLVDQGIVILDVSVFGVHPFGGLARRLENTVLRVLNDAIRGVEKATAKFESGLIDAIGVIVAIPLLLAFGVKAAFQYLWHSAIRPLIHSITDAIDTTATAAMTKATALERTVAGNVTKAESYADTAAAGALKDAKGYADHWIDNAVKVLNGAVATALEKAERYADTAIAKLRGAEDAAIADAVGIANAAKTAGLAAAAGALATAEHELGDVRNEALTAAAGALTTAEHYTDAVRDAALTAAAGALTTAENYADAAAAIAKADAAAALAASETVGKTALATVESIAVGVGHELKDLEGIYGALGTASLIASIPAIATLVHAIATEAGLENASCRSKVKDVCGADPLAWGELLAGLAALGFGFSLRDMYDAAEALVGELAPVIRQAA